MANIARVRVRRCKYIRHKGNLYGAGETFKIDADDWSLSGIGRLVELVPGRTSSLQLPPRKVKKKVTRDTVQRTVRKKARRRITA